MIPASLMMTICASRKINSMTVTKPEDIEPSANAFKAWLAESETAIKNVVEIAIKELQEIGAAVSKVRRLWAELKNEI
jgi:hypothetical protein